MFACLQMIRLTQPELVHDKKQQDSSSPDESAGAIKKEVVTPQGVDQASLGNLVPFQLPSFGF